jgi:thiamine-phosphate pyrophosphorylase
VTRLLDLSLYLVTDTALCGDRGVVETVRAALPGGVTAVQVRAPSATTRELCALTLAVHEVLAGTGVPLLVNDRLDVALATGAEGVHLGQSDLAPEHARRLGGTDLLIGLSVSTLEQVAQAAALPRGCLDYLGVGPVRATATKPEPAAPLGLDGTARLVAASPLPCVAIGGIGVETAAAVRATGAAGIAVVSAICAAADPAAAAVALLADGAARP